ncbi:MAG: glycoside hydrolase family 5 protein [Pirellula sp.]|nr:glycoside hydrolase family 5 protein [Pirellula sp.]
MTLRPSQLAASPLKNPLPHYLLSIHACAIGLLLFAFSSSLDAQAQFPSESATKVSINGNKFLINDQPTYFQRTWNGSSLEGLLLNSRMVQATFDDRNPETRDRWIYPDTKVWNADRNTREFIAQMKTWRDHGLLAVTINLQGGSPEGYSKQQPWHNSAILADGSLDPKWMNRTAAVIEEADRIGMVIILGLFYFGQDERIQDEAAVIRAVDSTCDWLIDRKYTNVMIEINNECNVRYDHEILQPDRVHELIVRMQESSKSKGHSLLVSTSYGGGTIPKPNVARVADFILLHGNGVSDPRRIREMVKQTKEVTGYRGQPIVFNEDDHFDFDKPTNNFTESIHSGASWGYFDFRMKGESFDDGFQSVPVNWTLSSPRKRSFFQLLSEMTGQSPALNR